MMKKILFFLLAAVFTSVNANATEIIAHRGYWDKENSVQNSMDSLKNAHEQNFYGSEMDVYITTDGIVVVNHEAALWGVSIENNTWENLKQVRLPNGENLPSFEEYLIAHKNLGGDTKLIIEVKPHESKKNNDRVVDATLDLVKKHGLEDKVEYVSFGQGICKRISEKTPKGTTILYLSGDLAPKQLAKYGITGFDYLAEIVMLNPEWIIQAKKMGLKSAVWTVNDTEKMKWCIDHNVDFITTDKPVILRKMIEENSGKTRKKAKTSQADPVH